jgi:fucose permease
VTRTARLGLAAFVAIGMVDGMLGPAWPSIRHDLGQPVAALGELVALATAGAVVSGIAAARLRRRLGPRGYVAGLASIGALALAVFAAAPVWGLVLGASFVAGFGGAAIDAGFNMHAALHHGSRAINALHACYGIGATLGPLVVAAVVAAGTWRAGWAIAAAAWVAVAVATRHARLDAPLPSHWEGVRPAFSRSNVALMLALFFVSVGVEAGIGAWGATLLQHRGWGRVAAAAWVASYWGAFTAARVLLSIAGDRLAPERALRLGSAVVVAGLAALLWTPLGLPLSGIGVAAFFPALVTLTPFRLGPERVQSVVGYQFAAGTIGGTVVVAAAGVAAQWLGSGALAPFLLGAGVVLALLELTSAARATPRST